MLERFQYTRTGMCIEFEGTSGYMSMHYHPGIAQRAQYRVHNSKYYIAYNRF